MLSLSYNDLNKVQMSRLNLCSYMIVRTRKMYLRCVCVCVSSLHSFHHSFYCLWDGASEFLSEDDFRVFLIWIQ